MSASAPRTALICGISGQDGGYLAQHLLERGYRVVGTSRDAQISSFGNLEALGIRARAREDGFRNINIVKDIISLSQQPCHAQGQVFGIIAG